MKTWHFEFDITLSRAKAEKLLVFLAKFLKRSFGKDTVVMFTQEGKDEQA